MATLLIESPEIAKALLGMMNGSVIGFNSDAQPMILWRSSDPEVGWTAAWLDPEVDRVVDGTPIEELVCPWILVSVDRTEPAYTIVAQEEA